MLRFYFLCIKKLEGVLEFRWISTTREQPPRLPPPNLGEGTRDPQRKLLRTRKKSCLGAKFMIKMEKKLPQKIFQKLSPNFS